MTVKGKLPYLNSDPEAIYVSTYGSGKMAKVVQINSNPVDNTFCQKARQCNGSICGSCYSLNMMETYYEGVCGEYFTRNWQLMSQTVIPDEKIPKLTGKYSDVVRFNAHGELENDLHLCNIMRIAELNPKTRFSLWTKRTDVVKSVLSIHEKPENLHLIWSNSVIGGRVPSQIWKLGFEKSFTVYSPDQVEKDGVRINCGAKSCRSCMRCYSDNNVREIKELLK